MTGVQTCALPIYGMTASFDATSCCFKTKAGKTIAGGTRTGKDLYQFTRDPPRVEYANISHTAPSLETWHCHLGHISYQAVIDMAKKGLTRGMPVDLSALLPICEQADEDGNSEDSGRRVS